MFAFMVSAQAAPNKSLKPTGINVPSVKRRLMSSDFFHYLCSLMEHTSLLQRVPSQPSVRARFKVTPSVTGAWLDARGRRHHLSCGILRVKASSVLADCA